MIFIKKIINNRKITKNIKNKPKSKLNFFKNHFSIVMQNKKIIQNFNETEKNFLQKYFSKNIKSKNKRFFKKIENILSKKISLKKKQVLLERLNAGFVFNKEKKLFLFNAF